MIDTADMTERHVRMLAEVAEAARRLALWHAERAMACEEPRAAEQATTAFHRASRCMRQCQALEAKLVRDAQADDRAQVRRAEAAASARTHDRRAQVQATVERLARNEGRSESEAERLCGELDDLLDVEARQPGFQTEDLTQQVSRLCRQLGLTSFQVMAVLQSGAGPPAAPPDRPSSA